MGIPLNLRVSGVSWNLLIKHSPSLPAYHDSMITPQNIMRHELVGLEVEITHSLHGDLKGIKGCVVDETKNTLTIEDGECNEKIIPKGNVTFKFTLPNGVITEIEGKIIVSRPEDRIKKRFRKYW